MINLLPPPVKEQMRYARANRLTLRYLRLLVIVIATLGVVFGASLYFLDQQVATLARDVTAKQQAIAQFAPDIARAQDAASRLTAIKSIQASQTRFSLLLDDLAKVLPQGVAISSITLTGNASQPVSLSVTGSSYNAILAFRDALATSPRISGVDLQSITQSGSVFQSGVIIGFKPGQAK